MYLSKALLLGVEGRWEEGKQWSGNGERKREERKEEIGNKVKSEKGGGEEKIEEKGNGEDVGEVGRVKDSKMGMEEKKGRVKECKGRERT